MTEAADPCTAVCMNSKLNSWVSLHDDNKNPSGTGPAASRRSTHSKDCAKGSDCLLNCADMSWCAELGSRASCWLPGRPACLLPQALAIDTGKRTSRIARDAKEFARSTESTPQHLTAARTLWLGFATAGREVSCGENEWSGASLVFFGYRAAWNTGDRSGSGSG
jgi:hypothetical protein